MDQRQRIEAIEKRMLSLETRLRRYRGGLLGLSLTLVAGVVMGQATAPGHLSCTSLEVVGENGERVVTLENSSRGGKVRVFHPTEERGEELWATEIWANRLEQTQAVSGSIATRIEPNERGGAISLLGKQNSAAVAMNVDDVGGGAIRVSEPMGGQSARMGFGNIYRGPMVELTDFQGVWRARLRLDANEVPRLHLSSRSGQALNLEPRTKTR